MMIKDIRKRGRGLLPLRTIEAASGGDVDAINAVLKHFEGYIAALSAKRFTDDDGNARLLVDEETKRRLETKLITKILTFDVDKAA